MFTALPAPIFSRDVTASDGCDRIFGISSSGVGGSGCLAYLAMSARSSSSTRARSANCSAIRCFDKNAGQVDVARPIAEPAPHLQQGVVVVGVAREKADAQSFERQAARKPVAADDDVSLRRIGIIELIFRVVVQHLDFDRLDDSSWRTSRRYRSRCLISARQRVRQRGEVVVPQTLRPLEDVRKLFRPADGHSEQVDFVA